MQGEASRGPSDFLRQLTPPVALAVAALAGAAWYFTWASTGLTMDLVAAPSLHSPVALALLFGLMLVMMVAMMLPSALPMVLTYHRLSRLQRGQGPDGVATVAFASAYFVLWGALGLSIPLAIVGLVRDGPLDGALVLVPAGILAAAGAYQITRTKGACLRHCHSPMGFVMAYWRSGRKGALRMGLTHAAYCIGCCWLLMVVLFTVGAMSLPWMGALSLAILVEKAGPRPVLASRAIGVLLLTLGALLVVRTLPVA